MGLKHWSLPYNHFFLQFLVGRTLLSLNPGPKGVSARPDFPEKKNNYGLKTLDFALRHGFIFFNFWVLGPFSVRILVQRVSQTFKALQRGHMTNVMGPISYKIRLMAHKSFEEESTIHFFNRSLWQPQHSRLMKEKCESHYFEKDNNFLKRSCKSN